jgi:hypothetical protein
MKAPRKASVNCSSWRLFKLAAWEGDGIDQVLIVSPRVMGSPGGLADKAGSACRLAATRKSGGMATVERKGGSKKRTAGRVCFCEAVATWPFKEEDILFPIAVVQLLHIKKLLSGNVLSGVRNRDQIGAQFLFRSGG